MLFLLICFIVSISIRLFFLASPTYINFYKKFNGLLKKGPMQAIHFRKHRKNVPKMPWSTKTQKIFFFFVFTPVFWIRIPFISASLIRIKKMSQNYEKFPQKPTKFSKSKTKVGIFSFLSGPYHNETDPQHINNKKKSSQDIYFRKVGI